MEYSNFADIFLLELAAKLLEFTEINDYVIHLVNDKQAFYQAIYWPELVKLDILKSYIKMNLVNSLIRLFKISTNTPILFVWKLDGNFCIYVAY